MSDIDGWARAHHGLITPEAAGVSRSAWYRAIRAGSLLQLHPSVARLPGAAVTREQQILAAVLAVGDTAIASHRSAAYLWGIPRPDTDPIDLIDARTGTQMTLESVNIHRPTDRVNLIPQRRSAIRCTSIPRTLADLGAVDPTGVVNAVGHALSAELVGLAALRAIAERHGRRGRPGIPALRKAIEHWTIDGRPADSDLELVMLWLVERFELPGVEFHPRIEGYEVDFRVSGTALLLECDGWAYHGRDRPAFERDRARDAALVAAGWIVVRFTHLAITSTPHLVAERIATAVERWSTLPAPDAA